MENNIQVYVLSGADASLLGLCINGWSVKAAYKIPTCCEDDIVQGKTFFQYFESLIDIRQSGLYKHDGENEFYIYLKRECVNPSSVKPVIDVLRTFKISRIGTYNLISFNKAGGCIINGLFLNWLSAPYQGDLPTFSLCENEAEKLLCFFERTKKSQPLYVENMLSIFHESFRIENNNIRFIMRITILEMLIDGNTELNYRLSRSVAVFLGKSQEESREIFDTCKKLYNARSKYLHNGDDSTIATEYSIKALDYSRRIIANLLEINEEINDIRRCLESGGFGSNPFDVKF